MSALAVDSIRLLIVVVVVVVVVCCQLAVTVHHVTAVAGKRAELPCDINAPVLDTLYLVLWYRNDSDFPICK